MERIIQHGQYGQIKYIESFWTGRANLEINGVQLEKKAKRKFEYVCDNVIIPVDLKGNLMTGVTLYIGGEAVVVEPRPKWYEFALTIFTFLVILIWGNVTALCKIVPLVGGAIGGLVCAVFAMLNLFMMRKVRNVGLKLLVFAVCFALNFLCCYLIALAFLSAAA